MRTDIPIPDGGKRNDRPVNTYRYASIAATRPLNHIHEASKQHHQSEHRKQGANGDKDFVAPEREGSAVMTQRWRLVHGKELYDIAADPSQQNDVAEQHPEIVVRLRAEHEAWWAEVTPTFDQFCHISLGNDAENPTRLDAMDVMGDVAWHQTMIVNAKKITGRWNVDVEQPGKYKISLRRWPEELGLPIDAAVTQQDANSHIYASGDGACKTLAPVRARLQLFNQKWIQPVEHGMKAVTFTINLEQTGETQLEAWFSDETGDECGAYYVYVERA